MQPFPTSKFFAAAVIVVFLLYGIEWLTEKPVATQRAPAVYSEDAKAHAQTLTTLNMQQLDAVLGKGGPSMLYVFASWCPYCRQQTPILEGFLSERSPDMTVLAISIDQDAVALADYLLGQPTLSFHPQLLGDQAVALRDRLAKAGAQYTGSIPYTAFFNSDGKMVAQVTGLVNNASLNEAYAQLKAKK